MHTIISYNEILITAQRNRSQKGILLNENTEMQNHIIQSNIYIHVCVHMRSHTRETTPYFFNPLLC